jgi:cell division protein FtsI/penicillin-binding protein 2
MTRPSRVGLVHVALALFAIAIVVKAARIQLGERARWAARAERQQSTERVVPAPRGDILDAEGNTLAQSRQSVKLDVAPPEVRVRAALRTALL